MTPRPGWGRIAVAALLLAGCSGIADLHIPTPPPGSAGAGATTTVVSDLTGAALETVPSAPPTSVVLTPGQASLSGIVNGPTGVVGGATVLVERLVGATVGSKTVTTQADGTWKLPGILGGLYRLRAWQAPNLALTTPQILLLGAGQNQNVILTLTSYNGQSLSATILPSPPLVGEVTTLVVQATAQTVGNDGVVRGTPLPGANIFVVAAGNVVLAGTNPGTSDATGRMVLNLGCSAIGPVGLSAILDGLNTFPLMVADCAAFVPPATTTTTRTTIVRPTTSSVP